MLLRLLLALLLVVTAGWGQVSVSPKPVLDADRAFNQATQRDRLDGWMSAMAPNVVLFGITPPVVGKDAVRKFYESPFSNPDFSLTWEPATGEIQPSGVVGYTSGRWTMRTKNTKGVPIERHGSYLTVWSKQTDGTWKVIADGGSPDH